jgi:hypothetical protein
MGGDGSGAAPCGGTAAGPGSPAAAAAASAGLPPLAAQALLLAVFAAWAVLSGLASPLYGRLYRRTHAPAFDERDRVPITPPPGDAAPPVHPDAGRS